jgi:hypothetical protein
MKTFLMTLLCFILTATISSAFQVSSIQAAKICPQITEPISSTVQVSNRRPAELFDSS